MRGPGKKKLQDLFRAVRATNADIPAIVERFGLSANHEIMIRGLLEPNPNLTAIHRESGFSFNTVKAWGQQIGIRSQANKRADKRAEILYKLSKEEQSASAIAQQVGVHITSVSKVAALTGTQGRNHPKSKENAIRRAIKDHPEDDNQAIADRLGHGFARKYVWFVRRKIRNAEDSLPTGMRLENLFFDAAVEIVKRHLEKGDIEKLEQVITCSRKSGWMPLFEGKIPWPASTETFPCQPIPKYRFLDVALTLYLREARIKSADHLKSIVEKGFFQFSGPLPIFQALHLVFAAREVSFDRLKIQNGPKQAWLPTRSQMIIKAKKVLAYAKR